LLIQKLKEPGRLPKEAIGWGIIACREENLRNPDRDAVADALLAVLEKQYTDTRTPMPTVIQLNKRYIRK